MDSNETNTIQTKENANENIFRDLNMLNSLGIPGNWFSHEFRGFLGIVSLMIALAHSVWELKHPVPSGLDHSCTEAASAAWPREVSVYIADAAASAALAAGSRCRRRRRRRRWRRPPPPAVPASVIRSFCEAAGLFPFFWHALPAVLSFAWLRHR